jgi:hypothetical protein
MKIATAKVDGVRNQSEWIADCRILESQCLVLDGGPAF